mmetsp:Transcript_36978/g.106264  ORF Transcript_36978/g.106264 Transcript_36978/m.106264 type:complete len:244 (+) Transcript_36978:56-787(+)
MDCPRRPSPNATRPDRALNSTRRSLHLAQVVLHLGRGQNAENPVLADDPDLDVVGGDGLLEALLERQDGGVDGVLELDVLVVALLQEALCVHVVLADGRGLPGEVGATGVHLEELRARVVVARNHERDAEGPHASRLRELLHDGCLLPYQLRHRLVLPVSGEVLLCLLPAPAQQHPVVGGHPCIDHADGVRKVFYLPQGRLVDERACHLLLRRQDNTVLRLDAQRGTALGHAIQGILDLEQLP